VKKGFFKEQGLDVQVVATTGGAAAIPGVMSGEFDFVFANVASVILACTQNLPLKVLGGDRQGTAGISRWSRSWPDGWTDWPAPIRSGPTSR
jgi:ABC-type nitrate/sulfonate/bicarbonate transport system substrate-binding protein